MSYKYYEHRYEYDNDSVVAFVGGDTQNHALRNAREAFRRMSSDAGPEVEITSGVLRDPETGEEAEVWPQGHAERW